MTEPSGHASAREARPASYEWVAAIYPTEHGARPLGSGFLIHPGDRVVTCAHVVWEKDTDLALEHVWVHLPNCAELVTKRFAVARTQLPRRWLECEPGDREVSPDDVAVLHLAETAGARYATRIRRPEPKHLPERPWSAFGFHDVTGDLSHGVVRNAVAHGQIRLCTTSEDRVDSGYSGAGIWCAPYDAVVGLIARADGTGANVRAITLWYAARILPEAGLAEAADRLAPDASGEAALTEWGWTLARDAEASAHWIPRARGGGGAFPQHTRPADLFRGRRTALEEIRDWLSAAAEPTGTLVVTGSPGSGKSAVLGRIVTTADPAAAAGLAPQDTEVRAEPGSVHCAVHAKGKTALEVAQEIARAASAGLPERAAGLTALLGPALSGPDSVPRRFAVVIDALDEAASADGARAIIRDVINPLTRDPRTRSVRLVVGSRRSDGTGGPLLELIDQARVIDLDARQYADDAGLVSYLDASLPPGRPRDVLWRSAVADIADRARGNYLKAQLDLLRRLTADQARPDAEPDANPAADAAPAEPATLPTAPEPVASTDRADTAEPGTAPAAELEPEIAPVDQTIEEVGESLSRYAEQIEGVGGHSTTALLTALAFAEAPGFTAELWSTAVSALNPDRRPPDPADLGRFAAGPAANLVTGSAAESDGRNTAVCYRLFHQALGDALLRTRAGAGAGSGASGATAQSEGRAEPDPDHRALSQALLKAGRALGWASAPGYLLRSLPGHAVLGGTVDDLLGEADYPLYADLPRLSVAADRATSEHARKRAELLRKTRGAHLADPFTRAAMFSVTEAQDRLGESFRRLRPPVPYRAAWASVVPQEVELVLNAHEGGVTTLCALTDGYGGTVLVTGGDDGAVKLWDETSTRPLGTLPGHEGAVSAVCTVRTRDGGVLLISGGEDRSVRVWDPRTQQEIAVMTGHDDAVTALCEIPGRPGSTGLVASGSLDGTVRIWDPATGRRRRILSGQLGEVASLCLVPASPGTSTILACGGFDGTVRLWRGPEWTPAPALPGSGHGTPRAMCAVPRAGSPGHLLAVGGSDTYCRVYDLDRDAPKPVRTLPHDGEITALCTLPTRGGGTRLAVADDSHVSVWDARTWLLPRRLTEPAEWVQSICAVSTGGGRALLALGVRRTGTVRLWDPDGGSAKRPVNTRGAASRAQVSALCEVPGIGARTRSTLARVGSDPVARLLDPSDGHCVRDFPEDEHLRVGTALCLLRDLGGQQILALGGEGHTIVLWNPSTGEHRTLRAEGDSVAALCAVTDDAGRTLLASAGENREVQVWDPLRRAQLRRLRCGEGGVHALCLVPAHRPERPGLGGGALLAAAGEDGGIHLWHTRNWRFARRIPAHDAPVTALCALPSRDGTRLLASCGADGGVRLWDPDTGDAVNDTLHGHKKSVNALCGIGGFSGAAAGRTLLVSGGDDRVVRLWNPDDDAPVLEIPVRHRVLCLAAVGELIHVGLTEGITALEVLGAGLRTVRS
ncbi:trypsin-like peptidase domain-containing protein [Actinospica durhamensis]|uniref:Trypsin-like peptidase domain-containing protein n=1 Tax=Actinospica durhamensis TaxID=1508375 RepID=A0A941EPU4_9ACTN|nr:trypsin-like peptidase domain-containing protein [Actinospica durhamensis]MBR7832959.1 trypsin-like peptidase domain-containing protein [Actinospica durhamensis]